ncbi:RDD family protein [Mycobacterium sp. ITM-2016-00317]|uniref:RDD family protein n=1 Tax=Mycobacterium sp. ITM-2016-00317 TaxID=2099694 RepID=UPI00287FECC1|nr:RDD family protein [Mycobacterium sp. ITM-2016-00317]WNG86424.1 RDD family protein [Mycobacterium sp. ITM-2016-00317]
MNRTAPRLPRRAYTSWWARVAAWSVDAVPVFLAWAIWETVAVTGTAVDCVTYDNGGVSCRSVTTPAIDLLAVAMLLFTLGYLVWNHGYRQGATGASLGKTVLRFRVVDEKTWQPVGFGASLLRQLVHLVDAVICFVGFLFPLWDARRQTLADKLVGTVCVSGTR